MYKDNTMKNQKGFTLIELAIVLVIVGLLLGGVLKGQELITQAKIKNVAADFSGVASAYYGYQDRYKAIPGDDPNSAARWNETGKGNGDSSLGAAKYNTNLAAPSATDGTEETSLFWRDLRLGGFVGGTGGANPNNAVAGMLGVQQGGDLLRTVAGTAGTGFSGLMLCSSNIPDKIAAAIDSQMDDGNPQSGSVRAALQGATPSPDIPQAAAAGPAYGETGSQQYVVCKAL